MTVRLVEIFTGSQLATVTAKALLIDTNRVSQAPHATLLDEHGHVDRLVARPQHRMEATLHQGFRVSEPAAHLGVSERTLNLRFKVAPGDPPATVFEVDRILLTSERTSIAPSCSLETSELPQTRYELHFRRIVRLIEPGGDNLDLGIRFLDRSECDTRIDNVAHACGHD